MRYSTGKCGFQWFLVMVLAVGVLSAAAATAGQSDQEAKMAEVIRVIRAISVIPEETIPPALLANARAIAIIPSVIKIGLLIGGRYGQGVIAVRRPDGDWSRPVFVSITGGSIGWQIGAQSTDVVLVFKSSQSIEDLVSGKFTLGADASVAAGPVGRQASAATDPRLKAEIYSYSRSRGLFAGVALNGAHLELQPKENEKYYRQPGVTARQIFNDDTRHLPESAGTLMQLLGEEARL
jgi:lipid-binding SYLF domain-containing protein